jgi:hypothetical protein
MTEKEKANRIVQSFMDFTNYYQRKDNGLLEWNSKEGISNAKKCAMIAVDELIVNSQYCSEAYWIKVKSEIEAL